LKFDIESYARDNLEGVKFTSTGELTAECPWCGKFGGFYINRNTGNFVCFKCDERGRHLVGVISQVEGVSWREARSYILKNAIQFRRKETTQSLLDKIRGLRPDTEYEDDDDDYVDVELPSEFIPVYNDKTGKWSYPTYLKERHIKRETARVWGLGYCNTGRYALRIVFPVECPGGRSFVARDATNELEVKVLNPKGADHHQLLLGWKQVKPVGDIALVEGPFDAIKLWQHGIPALAMFGKVLHSAQLTQLFTRSPDSAIVVMLDPEESIAPYDVAQQLLCKVNNVSIAMLPEGIDPGDSTSEQAWNAYNNAEQFDGNRQNRLRAILGASRAKISKQYA